MMARQANLKCIDKSNIMFLNEHRLWRQTRHKQLPISSSLNASWRLARGGASEAHRKHSPAHLGLLRTAHASAARVAISTRIGPAAPVSSCATNNLATRPKTSLGGSCCGSGGSNQATRRAPYVASRQPHASCLPTFVASPHRIYLGQVSKPHLAAWRHGAHSYIKISWRTGGNATLTTPQAYVALAYRIIGGLRQHYLHPHAHIVQQ